MAADPASRWPTCWSPAAGSEPHEIAPVGGHRPASSCPPVRLRARARCLLLRPRPGRARRRGERVSPRRAQPAQRPRRSATTTTSIRRPSTCPLPIADHLRLEGIAPDGWRITLVTNLRVLGYVFNPASFYLCRDPDGALQVVIVEVHNTHRERHLYTLRRRDDEGTLRRPRWTRTSTSRRSSTWRGRYTVRVRDEPSRLRITINEDQDGELLLHTSLDLTRRRMSRSHPGPDARSASASSPTRPPPPSTGMPCSCGGAVPASIVTREVAP